MDLSGFVLLIYYVLIFKAHGMWVGGLHSQLKSLIYFFMMQPKNSKYRLHNLMAWLVLHKFRVLIYAM